MNMETTTPPKAQSNAQSNPQKQTHSNEDSDLDNYVKQLSTLERAVLEIASDHLCSSFSLRHSIGFIKWSEKTHIK